MGGRALGGFQAEPPRGDHGLVAQEAREEVREAQHHVDLRDAEQDVSERGCSLSLISLSLSLASSPPSAASSPPPAALSSLLLPRRSARAYDRVWGTNDDGDRLGGGLMRSF